MRGAIEARLAELGLELPNAAAPAANYVPYLVTDSTVWVSGQISVGPDGPIRGRLGETMDVEEGAEAARHCALALLAQVRTAAGGDLGRLAQVIRITGYVASTPDFTDHPKVVNGASDLLVDILGEAGRHTRAAVGVAALPFGVAVEIDGVFALR